MTLNYQENQMIQTPILTKLYESVGWSGYSDHLNKMEKLLPNSLWWTACWDGENLIGLIRCIGDGVSIIYIQDLLVNPEYQKKGIGTHLIDLTLEKYKDIRQIVLLTDDTELTKNFYKKTGLQEVSKTDGCAFIRYNFNV